ncbi:UDP-N-acetylmuramoyl-L-alanyl-D-glutamate--2,6-diaminopimelate ligase [Clostridium folliculivorans]|uniref:UDP-N-acetylmuramoyl-L-alanyl-D-glutamate--2,6-diaminopimelate ligase n=1 Tax=Clostridium folliculivorans TaxID=2886038 RepID=A0A9W5Y1I2_9CLOT|nr:UDP-N-acetylmuramoyl-L-alanyl-D-glutamate--2,6-diaminopimelate ligase [Clostridium folliculivorans]GKU24981.1 UDP-N-acetylmuramoyl-L-alanyl-D-glutamate--2,6-diaminopimelate ligase 2 [Clostridium folliculivorans]GKU31079.1 UDP-N-acetylmuramoyl-L-alanyl-D-glutamate--2,6-diaminopimelate ligase 2 [Clostridium folliculivorans]
MKLYEVLEGIDYEMLSGSDDLDIESLTWDSRDVGENSLFIAVRNRNVDRHDFVFDAVSSGAIALMVEHEINGIQNNIAVIKVKDARRSMSLAAQNFYHRPISRLKTVGITGTNGKTSVSYFVSKILEVLEIKCGVIGTIQNTVGIQKIKIKKLNPTTPDAIELQGTFAEMLELGATHATIEVTSSALSQDRVYGCAFDIAVFTNLTQDHLEEHGTMDNYKNAKLKLFSMCKKAVVNIDDSFSKDILATANCEIITYGIDKNCDFRATDIEYTNCGVRFNLQYNYQARKVELNIPGRFSVYNALAAIASCYSLNLSIDDIVNAVKEIKGVPGRFQAIENSKDILAVVDYAHSPDAIENILTSVKEITKGKIITVFGCGGDRDASKRPLMGEVAGKLSDYCIITSDNPRSEEPASIINDIEKGLLKTGCMYEKIEDRKQAIFKALNIAEPKDAVIIAGKGHENYQILKYETIHFSDEEIVRNFL